MNTPVPHPGPERSGSTAAAASLPRQAQAQPSPAADELARSPRMTAQRQAMRAAFGPVAQLTSLNGILVDEDVPYPNGNQAAVLTHMAGEWDGAAGHAVTGGHLQAAMVAAWGPAVANSNPGNASASGVHFAGGLPGNNITPHQHTFRLARQNPGNNQTAVSLPKQSTFWPGDWDNAALIGTLGNSFRNGAANTSLFQFRFEPGAG